MNSDRLPSVGYLPENVSQLTLALLWHSCQLTACSLIKTRINEAKHKDEHSMAKQGAKALLFSEAARSQRAKT